MSYLLRYASCSWSSMVKGNGKHLLKYWKVRWADIGLNGRTRRKVDLDDLEEIWTIHLYFWYPWCEKQKRKEKSFVWTTKCIGKISWRGKARHCGTLDRKPNSMTASGGTQTAHTCDCANNSGPVAYVFHCLGWQNVEGSLVFTKIERKVTMMYKDSALSFSLLHWS